MLALQNLIQNLINNFKNILGTVGISDVIDIAIIAFLVYHAIRLMRETRAMQLIKGIGAIFVLYFVAEQFKLVTLTFFMQNILAFGFVVLAVLFQPELRRALEQMGRSKLGIGRFGVASTNLQEAETLELIEIIGDACAEMSSTKTGALIVIERQTRLGEIIDTGTIIDARPSQELIGNIFFTNSPLHDGAMVLRGGRLYSAGCYLPLSSNMEIGRELGTRHRAALGMSEVSDALVIVVSEETGAITVAAESRLQRGLSPHNLKKLLQAKLITSSKEEAKTGALQKVKEFPLWNKRKKKP